MPPPRRAAGDASGSVVAPYLTHMVSHHGQTTLIPPENAGRIRKIGGKSKTKKSSSTSSNGITPSIGSSSSNTVSINPVGGRRTRYTTTSSRQPDEIASSNSRRAAAAASITPTDSPSYPQRTQPEDFSIIPDFPPPSFQEAMRSTYIPASSSITPIDMRGEASPLRFGSPTPDDDTGFDSDDSLEFVEHPTPESESSCQHESNVAERGRVQGTYPPSYLPRGGNDRSPSLDLFEDVQPPTSSTSSPSRRHLSLSPLRTLFPSKPSGSAQSQSPHPYPYSAPSGSPTSVYSHKHSLFRSTTSLSTTTSSPPRSRPTSPALSHRLFSLKGKEREPIDSDWEVIESNAQSPRPMSPLVPDTSMIDSSQQSPRVKPTQISPKLSMRDRKVPPPPSTSLSKIRRPPPALPNTPSSNVNTAASPITTIFLPDNPPGNESSSPPPLVTVRERSVDTKGKRKPPPPPPLPKKRTPTLTANVHVASPLGIDSNATTRQRGTSSAIDTPTLTSTPSETILQRATEVPLPATPAEYKWDAVNADTFLVDTPLIHRETETDADTYWNTPPTPSSPSHHHYIGRPLPRPPISRTNPTSANLCPPPTAVMRAVNTTPASLELPTMRPPIDSTYAGNESFSISEFRSPQPQDALLIDFGNDEDEALPDSDNNTIVAQPSSTYITGTQTQSRPSTPVGEYSQTTDLDMLIAQLNDSHRGGDDYDTLLLLSEFVGPGVPAGDIPRPANTFPSLTGAITVERRRTTKDGRVKLKLTLLGASVDKCLVCLCQFRDNDHAVLASHACKHAFHIKCLARWLGNGVNKACPMCRGEIDFVPEGF